MKLTSRSYSARPDDSGNWMTSMIDVVFLLQIFFLVTSTFVQPERQLTSTIKAKNEDSGLQPTDLEPAIVTILRRDDRVLYQMGAVRTSDLNQLRGIMRAIENKADGGFVRMGDEVPFDHAAQVIAAFKSSGIVNVCLLPAE